MIKIDQIREQIQNNTGLGKVASVEKDRSDDIVHNFLITYEDGSRIHANKIGSGQWPTAVVWLHGMIPGKELWTESYLQSHERHSEKQLWSVDIQPHGSKNNPNHNYEALFDKKYGQDYNRVTQSHLQRFMSFLQQEEGIENVILESTSKGWYDAMLYQVLSPENILANILAAPSWSQEKVADRKKMWLLMQLARLKSRTLIHALVKKYAEEMVWLPKWSLTAHDKEIITDYVYNNVAWRDNFGWVMDLVKTISKIDSSETYSRLPELSPYAKDMYMTRSEDDIVTQPQWLGLMANMIGVSEQNQKIFPQGGHAVPLSTTTREEYKSRRDDIIEKY